MQRDVNGRVWRCRAGCDCGAGRQPARTLARVALGGIFGPGHGRLAHPSASLRYLWKLRRRARSKVGNDRRAAAGDPHSSTRLLNRLARDPTQTVRCAAATNPACPRRALRYLAQSPHAGDRLAAARDRRTSERALHRLARDRVAAVRYALAANPNIAVRTVTKLARDSQTVVRLAVAPRVVTDVYHLCSDADPNVRAVAVHSYWARQWGCVALGLADPCAAVRSAAAANPYAAEHDLDTAISDECQMVRAAAAANPAASRWVLLRAATDPGTAVRAAAAANPSTPAVAAGVLSTDPVIAVRSVAVSRDDITAAADEAAALAAGNHPAIDLPAALKEAAARLCSGYGRPLPQQSPPLTGGAYPGAHTITAAERQLQGMRPPHPHRGPVVALTPMTPRRVYRAGESPDPDEPVRESVDTAYRASSGDDFCFRLVSRRDSGWHVHVLEWPSYNNRSTEAYRTHLYHRVPTEPWVCWSERIDDLRGAVEVAAVFAETTVRYIATGRFETPSERPDVNISPASPLALTLQHQQPPTMFGFGACCADTA